MSNNYFSFYKMTGVGNDFIVFDNRKEVLPKNYGNVAKKVCDRKFSVGADGLLVLEKTEEAHFKMVYYNSDGSRAAMCGNGARCIARFAYLQEVAPAKMSFVTDAGILSAEVSGANVKLQMSRPKDVKMDFPLKLEEGKEVHLSFINTGVPHTVLFVSDVEKADVANLGRTIRFHREFSPSGTNANFVSHKSGNNIAVRTYERGVEGETLACGTGVVASSLLAAIKGLVESPVNCLTKGGQTLKVHFQMNKEDSSFTNVFLEGPAEICFKGEIELDV